MSERTHTRYGSMGVDRWQREGHVGKRVVLDGHDITDRCRWFNDATGEAECFVADDAGEPQLDSNHELVVEVMRGEIVVLEGGWRIPPKERE